MTPPPTMMSMMSMVPVPDDEVLDEDERDDELPVLDGDWYPDTTELMNVCAPMAASEAVRGLLVNVASACRWALSSTVYDTGAFFEQKTSERSL